MLAVALTDSARISRAFLILILCHFSLTLQVLSPGVIPNYPSCVNVLEDGRSSLPTENWPPLAYSVIGPKPWTKYIDLEDLCLAPGYGSASVQSRTTVKKRLNGHCVRHARTRLPVLKLLNIPSLGQPKYLEGLRAHCMRYCRCQSDEELAQATGELLEVARGMETASTDRFHTRYDQNFLRDVGRLVPRLERTRLAEVARGIVRPDVAERDLRERRRSGHGRGRGGSREDNSGAVEENEASGSGSGTEAIGD